MKWLALCFVAWQAARGVAEGITMYQPGPRAHPLFDWYHQIRLVEIATLCGACWYLFDGHLTGRHVDPRAITLLTGVVILAWEAFEVGYLWARLGQARAHENVLGLFAISGTICAVVHLARLTFGLALTIGGCL